MSEAAAGPAPGPVDDRFHRRSVVTSAILTTGGNASQYVTGMIVSILIARSLGPAEYGHFAYVVWLSGLLVTLCGGGFNNTAMRFIAECEGRADPRAARGVQRHLRRRLFAASAAGVGCLVLAWPWARPQSAELGSLSLSLLAVTAFAFATRTQFMFEVSAAKGFARFKLEPAAVLVLGLVNLAGVAALWVRGAPLWSFLLWYAAVSGLHVLLVAALARRGGSAAGAAPVGDALQTRVRSHLRWSVLLAAVGVFGSKSFEVLLLNAAVGAREVAYFTIAVSLTRSGVDLTVGGLSSVLLPVMSHGYGVGGVPRVRAIFAEATRYYQVVGLLLAGMGFFWAEPAVLLMYGEPYRPVVLALQVMVVGSCLPLAIAAYVPLLSATENQRLRFWFSVMSVGISAAFAFALVPRLGLRGALASLTASNWVWCVATVLLVRRMLGFGLPLGPLGRQYAAAIPAFLAGLGLTRLLPGQGGLLAGGALYLVAYPAATLASGAWTAKERGWAAAALRRVPGLGGLARLVERGGPPA